MIYAAIIGCEIAFWVLLFTGLIVRYFLKWRALSTILLVAVPFVDLVLLIAATIDMLHGATATMAHGLAAIYIGVSIAWGHQIIGRMDRWFAYKYANGQKPVKPSKYGREHAAYERRQWLRHLVAWLIGNALLGAAIILVGDTHKTAVLLSIMQLWSVILVIDFAVSFSYTLWPRRPRN